MASSKNKFPSYSEIIRSILASANGPLPVKEIAERMLELHPTTAKKPYQAMLQHIREENGRLLVYLDADTLLPLRLAYQGVRFRLPLDRETVNSGLINLSESFRSYLPPVWPGYPLEKVRFIDHSDAPIPFQLKKVSKQVNTIFGEDTISEEYANLSVWFRSQKVYHKDHLLFTIIDWENSVFQLEHEPARQRNEKLLEERNQLLADLFFNLLESETYEDISYTLVVLSLSSEIIRPKRNTETA